MTILKFIGALRHASGTQQTSIHLESKSSLLDIINIITLELPTLRANIIDENLKDPKPNSLILINGKEISVLDGLNSLVDENDEIVFVPVVHGG